jgi:hypothetical protein
VSDDGETPYRTEELTLPPLRGEESLELRFEATSQNPRPLSMALDWLEVGPGERGFRPLPSLRIASAALLLVALGAPWLAGASLLTAAAHASAVAVAAAAGLAWDPVAGERILTLGVPAYVVIALATLLLTSLRGRAFLEIEPGRARSALVLLVLTALAVRLALLLHPQFFYPDVRVHALFVWQLAKDGPVRFLQDFTSHQYRYSLGLQFESGHWYAFPYPPAFYLAAWPLVRLVGGAPEVAVSVLGAAVNALGALLIHALARRITGSTRAALAAAAASVLLPIFLVRLSLAYFPALVGHALDALVMLLVLRNLDHLERPRVIGIVGLCIAAALLTYTQSVLNLGLVLPLALLLMLAMDRTAGAGRRQLGLAAAGVLGATLALVLFYARYVPIFLDMRRGIPMAEEHVLTELQALRSATQPEKEEPPDDPYTGPDVDLWRGLSKAGWRLWIFYGPFTPLVAVGVAWLTARAQPRARPVLIAWASTYVLLNLASGGLPGPNLVRYNKDVELVAPLCCAALGWIVVWLWQRGRALRVAAALLALGFLSYGGWRGVRAFVSTFTLER